MQRCHLLSGTYYKFSDADLGGGFNSLPLGYGCSAASNSSSIRTEPDDDHLSGVCTALVPPSRTAKWTSRPSSSWSNANPIWRPRSGPLWYNRRDPNAEPRRVGCCHQTVEVNNGRVPVIAGCGSNSTRQTVDNIRAAKALGVDAALVVFYNKPNAAGLQAHVSAAWQKACQWSSTMYWPNRSAPQRCHFRAALPHAGVVALKEATGDVTLGQELATVSATPKWHSFQGRLHLRRSRGHGICWRHQRPVRSCRSSRWPGLKPPARVTLLRSGPTDSSSAGCGCPVLKHKPNPEDDGWAWAPEQ